MMKHIKKTLAAFLSGLLMLAAAMPVCADGSIEAAADQASGEIALAAKSAALFERSTGKLLHEMNSHEKMAPASITKVMTMLLLMEQIEKGTIRLDDKVQASEHACSMGGSQIWLKPGETMTVDELLRATAIGSANDAAVALAELIAGTEDAFVAKMNEKAKELGMNDTSFKNASGLDEEGHYTSAYDIGLMSIALLNYESITKYTSVWMDSLRNGETALVNTNRLVRFYEGCTGLKTGTTDDAGCCLSVSATKNGMDLIAVVMGSETSNDRFEAGRTLLDYGFASFAIYKPEISTKKVMPVPVKHGVKKEVAVEVPRLSSIVLPKGKEGEVKQQIDLEKSLEAPVAKGQKIGTVTFTVDGGSVLELKLTAAEPVDKMTTGNAIKLLSKMLFGLSNSGS